MAAPASAAVRLAYLCLEAPREGQASFVHMNEIAAGLRRRDFTVDIFAPSYSGQWQRPSLPGRLAEYLRLQARLALRLRRYDAIYVRSHPLAFPLAMLCRLTGKPVFHEINGTYEDLYVAYPAAAKARRLLDFMQKSQFRAAAGNIGVTPQLCDWLRAEALPRQPAVALVPNGANTDLFHPGAASGRPLPPRYVVFFGGLTRWHGVDDMLAAIASPLWPAGVALVVVGDGVEGERVRAAAATQPNLVVLGRLPYAEVPGVVAGAIAGLVPISDPKGRSSTAGLSPLKLYETLACGVPVIASRLPGQAELVEDAGCGLLFACGDGGGLAAAVATLAADPAQAQAMARRGLEMVRREHSWDQRAADTAAFIRRNLGR